VATGDQAAARERIQVALSGRSVPYVREWLERAAGLHGVA
jgi:hypothetical protein